MKKFEFPVLTRLQIKHFSLYKKADYLDIDLTKNVYVLAGANGLGKSTFITIINYALTGIVKNPERQFTWYNSIPAFYSKSKGFAEVYFDGRVKDDKYDLAEVTLDFTLGTCEYSITRGFFEPDELRSFSKVQDGKHLEIAEDSTYSDLNELYKSHFTTDVNLSEFDQFVFLQSYVFTFDETHQLISWDISLIERVLYLFFGVDADKAKVADQLRKEVNKYDSEVRNLQWQITRARNEMNNVKKKMGTVNVNDTGNIQLFETHKKLLEQSEETNAQLKRIADELKEADLNIADLSLKASSLRSEYSKIFNQTLNEDTPLERNAQVIQILNDLKLRIIAKKDFSDLIEILVSTIETHSKITDGKNTEQYFSKLQELDEQLSGLNNEIKNYQLRKDRLINDENSFTVELNDISTQIASIQKDNDELLRSLHNLKAETEVNVVVKSYQDQIERLSTQKDEAYRKRNKSKTQLEPLEEELNLGYIEAEKEFIPKFNQYAKSFLGLDINIDIAFSSRGASLAINIDEAKRKESFQLSESQRYFIDIALRMALLDLCTSSSTMLIDTPEGSLDIAYESRAGKMFADFAKDLHKLIVTANINSSQLLIELANICKGERMMIERMTNWTELSEVQQLENERIEQAYSKIEKELA